MGGPWRRGEIQGEPHPGVVAEKRVPTAGSEAPRSPGAAVLLWGFQGCTFKPCVPLIPHGCPTEPWLQQPPATSCLQQVWEQLLACLPRVLRGQNWAKHCDRRGCDFWQSRGGSRLCGTGIRLSGVGLLLAPLRALPSPKAAVRRHWASITPSIAVSCSSLPSPPSSRCPAPLLLPGLVFLVGTAGTGQDVIPREASDSSPAPLGHIARACRNKERSEIQLFRFIQTEKKRWKSKNNVNVTLDFLGFALKSSPHPTLALDSQAAPIGHVLSYKMAAEFSIHFLLPVLQMCFCRIQFTSETLARSFFYFFHISTDLK